MTIRFDWYSLLVGVLWDREDGVLYVCPLPMLMLRFGPKEDD